MLLAINHYGIILLTDDSDDVEFLHRKCEESGFDEYDYRVFEVPAIEL